MRITIGQLQNYMRQAGWPENLITTGAAVFYFESGGGETTAHKVDSIERSYGLAQINLGLPGSRIAAERASWGPAERLYDPIYNLQLAWQLYQTQGWGAWTNTYYGGRYQQYMRASLDAYNGAAQPSRSGAFGPVVAGIEGVDDGGSGDIIAGAEGVDDGTATLNLDAIIAKRPSANSNTGLVVAGIAGFALLAFIVAKD